MANILFVYRLAFVCLLALILFFFPFLIVRAVNVTTVVLPNGGECLTVGESYTIRFSWSGADVEHLAIYYRTDGAQPTHLDSSTIKHPINVPQQGTTWNWTPGSSNISETGRVWVDGHENGHDSLATWDNSDADFAVRADCSEPAPAEQSSAPRPLPTGPAPVFSFLPEPEPILPKGGGPVSYPPTIEFTNTFKFGQIFSDVIDISFMADDLNNIDKRDTFGISNHPVSLFYTSGKNLTKRTLIAQGLASTTSYTWRVRDIPDGNDYRVIAEVADRSGLVGQAITPPFTIDNSIPSAEVFSRTSIISWRTPTPTYSFVEYGERVRERAVSGRETVPDTLPSREHFFIIEGLSPNTTYHFRVINSITPILRQGQREAQDYFDPQFTVFPKSFTTAPVSAVDVSPVSGIFTVSGRTTMLLSWVRSTKASFETIIVRQQGRFARNPKDGEVVFRSNASYYRDAGLRPEETYQYSIFQTDGLGNFSFPRFVRATTKEGLKEVPTPPLEESEPSLQLRVGSFSSESGGKTVTLRWKNPNNPHFLGVQIVRNTESLPSHSFDGAVLFRGLAESFTDSDLVPGNRYLYGIFPFDWNNAFYSGSFTSGVPEESSAFETLSSFLVPVSATSSSMKPLADIQIQINALYEKVKEISLAIQVLLGEGPFTSSLSSGKKESMPSPEVRQSKTHIVYITESGFSPKEIIIQKGDTVLWIGRSTGHSWPASDIHPTHGLYPELGGCIGSTFDSCRTLSLGDEYSFLFNKVGVWQYHDHLNPLHAGTITVQ
ncbi:MAG: hypothetical protein HYT93_03145 [Parcubacteria group bacterium]|nr:hypothetical protein [Parcubacteria group bacterium]